MSFQVRFADPHLLEEFRMLKNGTAAKQELYSILCDCIRKIQSNPFDSIIIKKKQIPDFYLKKYGITNLRMLKPNGKLRVLYTIASDESEIMSIILEWLFHKEYEKRFKYRVR